MFSLTSNSKKILFKISNLEKKHKLITYVSLLFLTISTYFLRTENEEIKVKFASIEERNLNLKKNMILFNKNYEGFPLPVWQKVKRGNEFIIQYINPIYTKFFGHDFKYDKYEIIGRNNFELFPKKMAQMYYENDVAVAVFGKRLESTEAFVDGTGKTLKLDVVKWRDIRDKDTLVYGMVKEIIVPKK